MWEDSRSHEQASESTLSQFRSTTQTNKVLLECIVTLDGYTHLSGQHSVLR
jgi:hypothetical protein